MAGFWLLLAASGGHVSSSGFKWAIILRNIKLCWALAGVEVGNSNFLCCFRDIIESWGRFLWWGSEWLISSCQEMCWLYGMRLYKCTYDLEQHCLAINACSVITRSGAGCAQLVLFGAWAHWLVLTCVERSTAGGNFVRKSSSQLGRCMVVSTW